MAQIILSSGMRVLLILLLLTASYFGLTTYIKPAFTRRIQTIQVFLP